MIITLTPEEIRRTYDIAGQWAEITLTLGVKGKYGAPEELEGEMITLQGLRAEAAVARATGLPWDGNPGKYRAIDVGGRVEVRSIRQAHHSLILHPQSTHINIPYVLAYLRGSREVHLLGWCFGLEGLKKAYWADPTGNSRGAYFVPQSALKPFESLLDFLKAPERKPALSSVEDFI